MLEPDSERTISIAFKSTKEVTYRNITDIALQIVEASSHHVNESIPIKLSARSLFTKFRILPLHGTNFGALEMGSTRTKKLEIQNEGEFDFEYALYPSASALKEAVSARLAKQEERHQAEVQQRIALRQAQAEAVASGKAAKGASAASAASKKAKPAALAISSSSSAAKPAPSPRSGALSPSPRPASRAGKVASAASGKWARAATAGGTARSENSLTLDHFLISPSRGTIDGSASANGKGKQVMDIVLDGQAEGAFRELLYIDITNRDTSQEEVITYELTGEVCSPGIETQDFQSIFEEQTVVPRLERKRAAGASGAASGTGSGSGAADTRDLFAVEERVFCFAPVIASDELPPPAASSSTPSSSASAAAPSISSSSSDTRKERFKLINPSKVPCNVTVALKPIANQDMSAFSVSPTALHIPSRENRFVTVNFRPTGMSNYCAMFEAVVEKGSDQSSNLLRFEIRGEGTLPHITIEKPMTRDDRGNPLLFFPKIIAGRSRSLPVVLRNEGILPATAKFEMTHFSVEHCFTLVGLSSQSMVTLQPREALQFEVKYKPTGASKFAAELKMQVLKNSFENSVIRMEGEAVVQDIAFEGLAGPDAKTIQEELNNAGLSTGEHIYFGDVHLGDFAQQTFSLTNRTENLFRFTWQNHPEVSFVPSLGHLLPHASKTTVATYTPQKPRIIST